MVSLQTKLRFGKLYKAMAFVHGILNLKLVLLKPASNWLAWARNWLARR